LPSSCATENWAEGDQLNATLDFPSVSSIRRHSSLVDAPADKHFTRIMPPDLNEITTPQLAYLRLHGRDAARLPRLAKTVASRF